MNSQTTFPSSPMGPLHFSHPSQMTSFVVSTSRIRSFFRSSSSSKCKPPKGKKDILKVDYEHRKVKGSTFTPVEKQKTPSSPPPPPYRQSIEEDLYCENVIVDEELEKKRQALIEEDRRMSEALKSIGF
ncbi:hypothetical protein JCM3765_004669 [Sporobolomyces pararoseus]